jgi:anti-anti-sigma factor
VLKLEVQKSSEVFLVRCSGRIVSGDGAVTLLRAVKAAPQRQIRIDLKDISAIDAAALGTFAELERWAREGGRTLQLVNPSRRVRAVLETTGLNSVLEICPASRARDAAA